MSSLFHFEPEPQSAPSAESLLPPRPFPPSRETVSRPEAAQETEEHAARQAFADALGLLLARRQQEQEDSTAVEKWMTELEQEIEQYRHLRRKRYWKTARRVVLVLVGIWLLSQKHGNFWGFWFLFGGGAELADSRANYRQKVVGELARTSDPRAVNVLAKALREGDKATQDVVIGGLTQILPRLRASDARHITPEGMEALLYLLRRTPDAKLTLLVLKSLEQIGDERALPLVQGLAKSAAYLEITTTHYGEVRFADIERAARETLPFLEARAEQERLRYRLLRPVAPPTDDASTLLRPASGVSETPAEQLLRPVSPAEEHT